MAGSARLNRLGLGGGVIEDVVAGDVVGLTDDVVAVVDAVVDSGEGGSKLGTGSDVSDAEASFEVEDAELADSIGSQAAIQLILEFTRHRDIHTADPIPSCHAVGDWGIASSLRALNVHGGPWI